MKFIVAVFLCLLSAVGFAAQTEKTDYVETEKKASKPSVSLAKEDSEGNIIDNLKVFAPGDIPIYCYIDLKTTKPVAVSLSLIAVKVKGIRPNHRVIRANYKTKDGEENVTFVNEPDKLWLIGKYRIDISIDGKIAVSQEFVVEKPKPEK